MVIIKLLGCHLVYSNDGKLIKRPVAVFGAGADGALAPESTVIVGFDDATWAGALQAAR